MIRTQLSSSVFWILFVLLVCLCCSIVSTTARAAAAAWIQQRPIHSLQQSRQQQQQRRQFQDSSSLLCRQASTQNETITESMESRPTKEVRLNPLLSSIQPSKTVEINSLVKDMLAAGQEVTSLSVGEPDFDPPQAVKDALIEAIAKGDTRYTAVMGTLALRQAIADDLRRRKGIGCTYNPTTEILVSNGAKQSVYQGIMATAGVGDKVIVPAPYWPSYPEMVKLAGAEPIIVETTPEMGFLMTPQQLRTCLETHGDEIKLLILCNPSNPTGSVYRTQQLQEIAAVLHDYPSVLILADEIYERLVYYDDDDDAKGETNSLLVSARGSPSIAALSEELRERTLVMNGFSKAYAMTGLRLGYMAAPARLTRACTTIQSQFTSCASSLSQAAGLAALRNVDDAEIDASVQIMKQKRDYVVEQLQSMPYVLIKTIPMGAFYVLPDVSHYCNDDKDGNPDDTQFCLDLLRDKALALVPGSSFGAPGTIRISYATSLEELQVAMEKLRTFLQQKE